MSKTKPIDFKLIEACKKQKRKAQLQLYKTYCNAMFLVAYRYVKDKAIAEDVMQDAFIKAFKNIDKYGGEATFGAWLKRIVINQSIDELKKQKLMEVSLNEETLNVVDDNTWEVEEDISADMIITAINQQKDKYRLVLSLFLIEGYDHSEISQILGISEVASRTQLLRGKKLVKESLKIKNYAEGC